MRKKKVQTENEHIFNLYSVFEFDKPGIRKMWEMNECKLMFVMIMNDGIIVAQLDGRNKALENNLIGCSSCCCQFNTVIRTIVEVQRRQEKRKEEKTKENINPYKTIGSHY